MGFDKGVHEREVRLREPDVARQQRVDAAVAERKRRNLVVDLAHADARVLSRPRACFHDLGRARSDPAHADAGQSVGFGEGAGGDGFGVGEREDGGGEGGVDGADGVEEGAVEFVAEDEEVVGAGDFDGLIQGGFGDYGAGGVVGVAGGWVISYLHFSMGQDWYYLW